ncbi:MAG TPA: prolyl oligopeptidase family serine peptidase [Candidatus Nanopelagicales bacterium]
MTTVAPYGAWTSPISAEDLAPGDHAEGPVQSGYYAGAGFWWSKLVPSQGGRYAIMRRQGSEPPQEMLPAPWNPRSRVHEYGGQAWRVLADGTLLFVHHDDQRMYRLDPGSDQPRPLTPTPATAAALRYGELSIPASRPDEVWCVRETHHGSNVTRDVVSVPLDGSAASDPALVRSVVGGSQFLIAPRISPDGRRLAWIAWNHPQMPWDGTELRVADLDADGTAGPYRTLLGSTTESVLTPQWADNESLYVVSDRTGWWNLYRTDLSGAATSLRPCDADFAVPPWTLGAHSYVVLPDGRLATVRTHGVDTLAVLDPGTGELTDLDLGDLQALRIVSSRGNQVVLRCGGPRTATALRSVDVVSGEVQVLASDLAPDAAYLPQALPMSFAGASGRDVHAIVFPPHSPDFEAPAAELAPYVALVHGGPTAHVSSHLDPAVAYLTSRGIGVVQVNYGGSSGYGRAYRASLRGQWGVVDVADTIAVVLGLADAGLADRTRLAIEGGSAGGWTVLSALTSSDVFACGVSYFGVADLLGLAASTHDFESRYLDGLVGPLPQARALYDSRAPLNNVDGLSCPVLLLQGLDDPVVPPQQAEVFRDALVRNGIRHAYRAYEGESHGFRRAATIIDSQEAVLSFYGQALGFEPPGVPMLELWTPQPG